LKLKQGRDYLVFPLDFSSLRDAKEYVRLLDGKVGMFKIGLELFIDQGPEIVRMVKNESRAGIFLDLKLHDISVTVERAMERVAALGVDLVTVHCSSTKTMLQKAVAGAGGKTGVLGVTLLTDNDADALEASGFRKNFADDPAELVLLRAGMAFDAGCAGVVCSGRESSGIKDRFGKDFLVVTPGIRPGWACLKNDDQKRVTTPARAVAGGSDLIVIGRPIRDADDPADAALKVCLEIDQALGQA